MAKQLTLKVHHWGGTRAGAGRKRAKSKGVAHRTRESMSHRTPMHVNIKYRLTIRNKEAFKILKRAILNSRKKGLRILHYSMQSNHLHFIVEAQNNEVLTAGMRSLTVTLARGFKAGKVQLERYHLHVLRGINEAKNAIRYVLLNEQKHTRAKFVRSDEYSSLMGLKSARRFVEKQKLTLIMGKGEAIPIDLITSFVAKKAIELLC